MLVDFDDFVASNKQSQINISGKKKGSGPPLLLLHGFPQNLLIWHRVAEHLAAVYTVVAIDLRGYGQSSKPAGDPRHENYSKRVMAEDCIEVMSSFGYSSFYVCAHDRGARVAHKLCVDHPQAVKKVMMLDIAPTLAMYGKTDFVFANAYYHWFFLVQKYPFPENLINANPEAFMDHHMGRYQQQKQIFDPECYKLYVDMMKDPLAVHAMCEDYRAAATTDLDEHRADDRNGRKIECALMVLWGKQGIIERCFNAIEEWQKVSNREVVGEALDCGHYIPEEMPEKLLTCALDFFREPQQSK